jgi:hypothetical protein
LCEVDTDEATQAIEKEESMKQVPYRFWLKTGQASLNKITNLLISRPRLQHSTVLAVGVTDDKSNFEPHHHCGGDNDHKLVRGTKSNETRLK